MEEVFHDRYHEYNAKKIPPSKEGDSERRNGTPIMNGAGNKAARTASTDGTKNEKAVEAAEEKETRRREMSGNQWRGVV